MLSVLGRNPARLRLVLLVVGLVAGVVLFATTDLVDGSALRADVAATGPWAPLVYLVVSAVLGAVLVPGPLLAGLAGVLFGPVTGTLVTISSSVVSALLSWAGGRRIGADGVSDLLGHRAVGFAEFGRRYGTAAVLGERLAPGIPDSPLSWAFGALGLAARQVAVGTALGALPRAFAYTALGASLGHPTSRLGIAAIVVYVLTALVGAEIARRMVVSMRRQHRERRRREVVTGGGATMLDAMTQPTDPTPTDPTPTDGQPTDGQVAAAIDFIRGNSHAVLVTHRLDGGLQSSPVAAGVDEQARIVISTPSRTAKARNLRRDPRASVCIVTDAWFGQWVHLDATAEVVAMPEALPLLEQYYRRIAGEHPNWDDYRSAMIAEDRVVLRLTPTHAAGPGTDS